MLTSLDFAVPLEVPPQNRFYGHRRPVHQLIDMVTHRIWRPCQPLSDAEFEALRPESRYHPFGGTVAAADVIWYARTPGASEDGPLEEGWIAGKKCVCVGRNGTPQPITPGTALNIPVDIHAYYGFCAGRHTRVIMPEPRAYYVEIADNPEALVDPIVPADWRIWRVRFTEPYAVETATETNILFFLPGMQSFCGPITNIAEFERKAC